MEGAIPDRLASRARLDAGGEARTGRAAAAAGAARPTPAPPRSLWLAGDLHLGEGARDVLAPLVPLLGGAAGFANLEGPVVDPPRRLRLGNRARALGRLRAAGMRALGIANNHALDDGPAGRRRTAEALAAAGLAPAAAAAAVVELAGARVAITAHDLAGGVPDSLRADLERARRRADLLVATFHVTGPPSYLPPPALRAAADTALAAGAAVVAAHGTHALGPLERRGDALIAWGLGNLAFSCDCTGEDEALVLIVTPRAPPRRGVEAEVLPIRAGLAGRAAGPAPDAGAILDLLEALGTRGLERRGGRARI